VGLGGVLVEVLADVAIRTIPCRRAEVAAMLDQLKGAPILDGVRGRAGADKEALVEAILRLAQLLAEYPVIREIDLNPVAALPLGAGLLALDARVVVVVKGEVEP
ncbi:MAG: acetate--CoA ligase family protein, partial [Deltaproteobacteria bacterium]|nr:acetate--CoA ligase family protein [Deltaproteobacteria bacterium]